MGYDYGSSAPKLAAPLFDRLNLIRNRFRLGKQGGPFLDATNGCSADVLAERFADQLGTSPVFNLSDALKFIRHFGRHGDGKSCCCARHGHMRISSTECYIVANMICPSSSAPKALSSL